MAQIGPNKKIEKKKNPDVGSPGGKIKLNTTSDLRCPYRNGNISDFEEPRPCSFYGVNYPTRACTENTRERGFFLYFFAPRGTVESTHGTLIGVLLGLVIGQSHPFEARNAPLP